MDFTIKRYGDYFKFFNEKDELIAYSTYESKWIRWYKDLYFCSKEGDLQASRSIMRIKFPLRVRFEIDFFNPDFSVTMRMKKLAGGSLTVQVKNDHYEIVINKGTHISFFKNGKQIALLSDKSVEFLGQETMRLRTDFDIDQKILFTLITAWKFDFQKDHSTVSWDIGNINPWSKEYDKSWRPRKSKNL